jgi:hypothetical protein
MFKKLTWFFRAPAVLIATFLLFAGAYFGSTKDFETFLLSFPALGILSLAAFAATGSTALIQAQRSRAAAALVLICLTPLIYFCSYGVAQRLRFLIWAPVHYRQLEKAMVKDGIVTEWDSWGMAGQDTSSYLVVDTQNRLGSSTRADQWTKQIQQSCGVWQAQRMWPKLYVVTTYTNCPYDGVEPADRRA